MENVFITITGLDHYFHHKPFKIGSVVRIYKEHGNSHDHEAVCVEMPHIGTVGYVANSTHTTYAGTYSAGRLYDKMGEYAYAVVMFLTHSSVIAAVLSPEQIEKEKTTIGFTVDSAW